MIGVRAKVGNGKIIEVEKVNKTFFFVGSVEDSRGDLKN